MDNETEYESEGGISLWQKIVLVLFILVATFAFYIALDANKYTATVKAIEESGKVGVNPTSESLDFGDLSPGSSAVRRVQIENGIGIPVYVAVVRFGSITDIMSLDKNFFTVSPKSSAKVEFTVYMPASAPIGERLDGRVFLFKIPIPEALLF